MGEAADSSAGHAAEMIGFEAVDVVIDYLVPIGFGFIGLGFGPTLFGGLAIQNALSTSAGGNGGAGVIPNSTCVRIGGGILALVTLAVGYAFWRLGKHEGWVMKIVGKATGSFFLGTGVSYVFGQVIMAKDAPTGLVDNMANFAYNISHGG